jgi:teichuronic acid biosynthesis glycosyltransferase TuaC
MNVLVVTRMWPTRDWPRRGPSVFREVAALRRLGLHVEVLVPTRSGSVTPYLELASRTRSALRRGRFDIVHAHYGYSAFPARLQRRAPLVVTFHGNDLIARTTPDGQPTAGGRVETRLSREISRLADAVIVVAPHMVDLQANGNVRVIAAGVDLDVFAPQPREQARRALGLDPSRPYVLFAANPELTVKRFWLAQEALAELVRRGLTPELVAVGDRPHEEMARWMSAADVLLLTSITEGSPMVVKEAMACNLPVVSVPVGDVAARLAKTTNSHVVEPSAAALADALAGILATRERSNGREQAREFEIMHSAAQVIEVYESVLASRSR